MEKLVFRILLPFLINIPQIWAVVRNVKRFTVYNTMICIGLLTFFAVWMYEKFNYTREKIYKTS